MMKIACFICLLRKYDFVDTSLSQNTDEIYLYQKIYFIVRPIKFIILNGIKSKKKQMKR